MTKLNAIIIDDEKHCAETLAWQLDKYCPEIHLITSCLSPEEGIEAIEKHAPDLIFLDIEMPRMNGFQLLNSFEKVAFGVIFTTAFDAFAVQAFKVSAIDYLIKPIADDDLKNAVRKALKNLSTDQSQAFNFLMRQIEQKKLSSRIYLPTLQGLEFVEKCEIIRCESESNYTTIYLNNRKKIVISRTLKEFEDLLIDAHFFRVHNSHIVNLDYVQKYVKGDSGHLVMKNNDVIPVSRSKKQLLLDHLAL